MSQDTLVCARCQPLEERVAELEGALRAMSDELEDRSNELVGARGTLRTVERKLRLAELKNAKEDDDHPDNKKIRAIQEHWKVETGNKDARISARSKRSKLVVEQLRTYKADHLMEAISGVALLPYKRFGRRYVEGCADDLKNSMFDCIGTDDWIDENRKIFHRLQQDAKFQVERLLAVQGHYEALGQAYLKLVMNAACAREAERAGDLEKAAEVIELVRLEERAMERIAA